MLKISLLSLVLQPITYVRPTGSVQVVENGKSQGGRQLAPGRPGMGNRCVECHSCLYLLSDSQAPLFLTDSICVALPGMWSDEPYYAIHLASNSHCRQLRAPSWHFQATMSRCVIYCARTRIWFGMMFGGPVALRVESTCWWIGFARRLARVNMH